MFSLLLAFTLVTPPRAVPDPIAQAQAPCENTDTVAAADDLRELRLEQFGVAIEIPENYRAILLNNGSVQVVDPGTYNLIRCAATGGDPLGRGYSELLIRGASASSGQSLEATVRAAVERDRPDSVTGPPNQCISPYPLEDQSGYLVQTPTQRHAEFWVEPAIGSDITVIETTCDCSGMVERLVNVLDRTTLLSES